MNLNKIIRSANLFYSLATSELDSLPNNSDDLKTVLKNIEDLETYQARIKYAEENLDHISSGSSRLVYKSPDETIIKLAKNDKGIAQNKAESNPKMKSKFINKILSHADNYSWIETHYLDKISESDFKDMTKLEFEDFSDAIRYGLKKVSESDKTKPKNFDKIKNEEIYKEMKRIGESCNLMPGDIARISSWGKKDGHPILIDAGLTKEVFEEFYDDDTSSSGSERKS